MHKYSGNMYSGIFLFANRDLRLVKRIFKLHKIFTFGRFKGDFDYFNGKIEDEDRIQLGFVGIK